MNRSESIKEISTALSAAQGEIQNATKNAENPHFKSKYADLAELLNTVRPVFSKFGLSVIQLPSYADGFVSVETVVTHKSGEWFSGVSSCRVSKDDAQGVGSATTYLRRYSLAAAAGVAQEDDEGNEASKKGEPKGPKKLPVYPDESLEKNLVAWQEAVTEERTTGAKIVAKVSSGYVLTAEQQKKILALKPQLKAGE